VLKNFDRCKFLFLPSPFFKNKKGAAEAAPKTHAPVVAKQSYLI